MLNFPGIQPVSGMAQPCQAACRDMKPGTHSYKVDRSRTRQLWILVPLLVTFLGGTTRGAYADIGDILRDPVGIGDPVTYRDYADEAYRKMLKKRKKRRNEQERRDIEEVREEAKRAAQDAQAQADSKDRKDDKDPSDSDSDDYWKPKRDKDNGLTGSQFDAHSFMDADFGKHSFIDLLQSSAHVEPDLDLHIKLADHVSKDDGDSDDGMDDTSDKSDADPRELPISDDDRKQLAPDSLELHDWVPRPPDKSNNGGFGIDKDNGRPVPYRMNGHLEINRGVPWKPHD